MLLLTSLYCYVFVVWFLEQIESVMSGDFLFQDGVVLGADTRATEDTIVADKNCEKIHYIAKKI